MNPPSKLYRYRPLDDTLLDRELSALRDSYLFAPSFASTNDPMEAFYETGGPGDQIIDAMLAPAGKNVTGMYEMLKQTIDRFALVSFSETYEDLPMWAYYGSNFAGMCLEFDTDELAVGDFQNEKLRPVIYGRDALPALTLANMASEEAVIARITRKRIEWKHEKEWRFVTGEIGRRHYLDDALRRVFLGPRINPAHAERIRALMDARPVEVLQGEIRGFELEFRSVKPPRPLETCERVGTGKSDPADSLYDEAALKAFLLLPIEALLAECRRIALRPNMEQLFGIDVASGNKDSLCIVTAYKLRNGRKGYDRRYFDRRLQPISREP